MIKYFNLADLRDLKQSLKTFKTRKTGFASYNFLICGPYNLPDQNGRKDQDQEEYQENENNHENETEGEDRNAGTNEREEGETQVNYRPKRVRRAPNFYGEWVNTAITEPSSVKEALTGEEKEEWREAMEVEMESIKRNNVWELVELSKGRSSVGSKQLSRDIKQE